MNSKPIRGAIIGAGFFGGIQAKAWSRMDDVEIVGVADPDQSRACELATAWQAGEVFADAKSMIQQTKPDFVDIVTRPESHLELVELAASLGCAVICQKPMAPTVAQCEQMVASCQAAGVRLLIHENWRWQPWYRAVRQAIVDRGFGPLFHLNFRVRTGDGFGPGAYTVQPYFTEMERLFIYETLVHHLDIARFVGGEIRDIFCRTQRINPKIAGEDCVTISFGYQSGASGTIDANRINGSVPAPMVFGLLEVECEQGAAWCDADGKVWTRRFDSQDNPVEFKYPLTIDGYRGESVFAAQRHMIDCLINSAPCESEATQYIKSVRLMEACYRSAKEKQLVTLEP